MKPILMVFFLIVGCSSLKNSNIVKVSGYIPEIKQPKSNDCWATVTTIMISWKLGENIAIDEAMKGIGKKWFHMYSNNTGLDYKEKDEFIKEAGFNSEPPANYTLDAYIRFLKEFGLIWVTTSSKPTGLSSHAKLLIGIEGDGSYKKSKFVFIDPASGKIKKQKALNFFAEFENEAKYIVSNPKYDDIEFRIQIIHW